MNAAPEKKPFPIPEQDSGWLEHAMSIGKMVAYSCDVATGFTLRSANSLEVMGLPSAGPTQDWSNLILPDDLPFFENALKSIDAQTAHFEVEYRIRHALTGAKFWVVDRGEGEFDQAGKRLRVHGAIADISGRIGAERDIRDAAQLNSLAFEAARMGAWHLDVAKDKLTCSDELLALIGIEREKFDETPQAIDRIVHPEDSVAWRTSREKALAPGGKVEIEFRVILPKGDIRWFLSRGEIARRADGIALECYGVMIDITERKSAEAAAARLAALVASSEDAIIGKDLDGTITSWNHGAERLLGFSESDMIGGPITRIVPPELAVDAIAKLAAVSRGKPMPSYDSIRLRKDGKKLDVSLTTSAIRDAAGRIVGASTIARDISVRKDLEKRQTMLLRELSHRVKNTLAVIQAMTRQTLRSHTDPKQFAEAFEGRIRSLASSHALLTETNWRGASLADIIRNQLDCIIGADSQRFSLSGPDVVLPAEAATQLGLVLHELATNAAKHGALSNAAGRIGIDWTASRNKLRLTWRERGGPRIETEPARTGFGTALMDSTSGKVARRFDPAGLTCRFELPL